MSEAMIQRFRRLYKSGAMSIEQVTAMYEAGKITEEEFHKIID